MLGKKLSEMTLEELWKLFPIYLTEHQSCWKHCHSFCLGETHCRYSRGNPKGYTENGFAERVFHMHLRYSGDNNELYFRDYLIEHPDVAKKYQELKLKLWKQYEYNRDAYTNAKTELVNKYTKEARMLYGNRY